MDSSLQHYFIEEGIKNPEKLKDLGSWTRKQWGQKPKLSLGLNNKHAVPPQHGSPNVQKDAWGRVETLYLEH